MKCKKLIQEIVIDEYSGAGVQEAYREMTKEGLWQSEEKLFNKYFKKGSKILDVGCGSGRTTFPLIRMGYKVIGIDLTPAMITSAKKIAEELKTKTDFNIGNVTNLEFINENFDGALFSFNGWDQIPGKEDRLKALKEVYRVLKPGGYFIFTSHIREIGKRTPYWIMQWIKMYILERFGFPANEIEFGDKFWKNATREKYKHGQYIHIPKLSEIKQQIAHAGFELVIYEWRNIIAPEDLKLKSGNTVFFVCRSLKA